MLNKNNNCGLLLLRLAIGVLMLFHGVAKLGGIVFIENLLTDRGLPAFFAYGVYFTEIVAPLLIIIGFRTRLAALVFALGGLMAIYLVHLPELFTLNAHGGWAIELLGLYILGAVVLFFTGGGRYALSSTDRWD